MKSNVFEWNAQSFTFSFLLVQHTVHNLLDSARLTTAPASGLSSLVDGSQSQPNSLQIFRIINPWRQFAFRVSIPYRLVSFRGGYLFDCATSAEVVFRYRFSATRTRSAYDRILSGALAKEGTFSRLHVIPAAAEHRYQDIEADHMERLVVEAGAARYTIIEKLRDSTLQYSSARIIAGIKTKWFLDICLPRSILWWPKKYLRVRCANWARTCSV